MARPSQTPEKTRTLFRSGSFLDAPAKEPPPPSDTTAFRDPLGHFTSPAPAGNTTSTTNRPAATQTTNNPLAGHYGYVHQDLLDRTDRLIQESLARQYEDEQRWVEAERITKAREYDPSPSPTPSVSTDIGYDPKDFWHEDQVALNVILNARNEYSLMPSTWRMSLRGIPLPEGLFYTKTKNNAIRPRIYAHQDRLEYKGVRALRQLMDIHARVADLREKQVEVLQNCLKTPTERQEDERAVFQKIARQLTKVLQTAINWASEDGGLDVYGHQIPSSLEIINLSSMDTRREMRDQINDRMLAMADEWDNTLNTLPGSDSDEKKLRAPVVFGLVIYKHILFIVTLDAGDPDAVEHIPIQLNMGEKNQHQWNALAIMLTICWARDILRRKVEEMRISPIPDEKSSSDPDA